MIPPLSSLMAFEAVARLASFSRAGEELCITQSAVSHRVRMLEAQLGVKLFRRSTRSLALTLAGQRYLPVVQNALHGLQQGTIAVHRTHGRARTLQLLVTRAIASLWLVPRLDNLRTEIPHLEVSVVTHNGLLTELDLDHYEFDAAVFLANEAIPLSGLCHKKLSADYGLVVCNPMLLEGSDGLRHPRDLRHHTILHAQSVPEAWPEWLASVGVKDLVPKSELRLDHTGLTVQAALTGLGVAIAHGPLVSSHLKSGALVAPFPTHRARMEGSYYFCVWRQELDDCPEVIGFREWIHREMCEPAHVVS